LSVTPPHDDDVHTSHGSQENFTGILGEIVDVSLPQTSLTPQTKTKVTSKEKVKDKKNKETKKKRRDLSEKENLTSNLAEEPSDRSKSSSVKPSCDEKDSVKPEVERKKKRKRDMEGKPDVKKPKTSKKQENGNSDPSLLGSNDKPNDLNWMQSVSTDHSPQKVGYGKDKHPGKEGSSKLDIFKPKKPKCGAVPTVSAGRDSTEQSLQSGVASPLISLSPNLASKKNPTKPKKPKFGMRSPCSSNPDSQNVENPNLTANKGKCRDKEGSSKPKKPVFGVGAGKPGQQLSELAEELGELMKKTEMESAAVEQIEIPVVKPKKTVPFFSKKSS